ncbi:hypothetical protein B0H16DRAFT_1741699 [Mycena metata]|uniref:Uncharacterized protein n=1 Tax=Mycena metata TaxID=1033252 RepID=A0AAD7HAZ7_9AGAR|nr:hypothetical protein B0H16DRAFT_1741699 [Mycena metata]
MAYPLEHLLPMLSLMKEMLDDLPGGSASRKNMNHGSIVILDLVYGNTPNRSYLIRLISPLMFNVPLHYLCAFEVVNMDQLINYSLWHKLITALRSEWYDLVIYVSGRIDGGCDLE